MELLSLIEEIKAEEASISRLFSGEGRGVRTGRRSPDPAYQAKVVEAAEFVAEILTGRRPTHHLKEALTTSDFPLLFGDVLDRMTLAGYREAPASWQNYARRRVVRDFRPAKDFSIDGGEGVLDEVGEQEQYPGRSLSESKYEITVKKYGARMPFSWESMVNDDLDALRDVPERFGKAARRTEERRATELFVDTNGPHASLYTAGNKNIINIANGGAANNPPLTISGLQDGLIVLSNLRDADGEPILIEAVELVVPPALEVVAQNILNALQLELVEAGGVANQKLIAVNWMKNRMRLSINRYHPIVAATANGSRAWYLFANPGNGRPAIQLGFLRGHEEPEIFIKEPNARRVGGGTIDPMDGDFDTDSIQYKVRHVTGGSRVEPKATVASNGSGA
jgi:hypothetical protein